MFFGKPVHRLVVVTCVALVAVLLGPVPASAATPGNGGDLLHIAGGRIAAREVAVHFNGEVPRAPVIRVQGLHATLSTTLLSDGFEGTFPGSTWTLYHPSSGAADVDWGRSSARKSAGSYSIWCAGSVGGSTAPNDTNSWVIAGPFDLSSVSAGTLSFDVWFSTEKDHDYFMWMVSTDGSSFGGYQASGETNGFTTVTQDLTDWGNAGNVTGQPQVWIALVYQSDASLTYEGAYVDQVALTVDSGGGGNCGTYVLTQDNDDNSFSGTPDGDWGYCLYNTDSKHPIEFHIDVNETSITSAQLLILAHDVDQYTDPDHPEQDKVYVNNTYVGDLTGADDEDSTTVFTVPISALQTGRNRFKILVNQDARSDPDQWCVNLKQAQLIINGGCSGQASCRSVTTDRSSYSPGDTVAVTYEVDTSVTSQQIRVESNLVNSNGVIVAGTERVYTTSGSSNDPKTVNLSLPSNAAAGTYTAEILVFDKASGRLESTCQATFTVGGGGGSCTVSCTASVPSTATVNVPVQFSATATTSGCSGAPDYFWFPDTNTTATINQKSPQVTYDAPGTYTWQLVVVTSDGGRCEKTGTITVTSGGGGGGGGAGLGVTNGWIPVAINATGANGSVWVTNVGIFNTGSAVATITITIYTANGPIIKTLTLNPWGQTIITDIVGWLVPGVRVTGPINITSTQTIVITTRVFNQFGTAVVCLPNGTLGQALGMWTLQSALQNGQVALLPALIQNSWFRTNIGFTNLSSSNAVVQVELFNGNGTRVSVYNVTLAPHQWFQSNKPFLAKAGMNNLAGGSARITVISGSGVVTYGSVIDNITNDPTTIEMIK